MGPAARGGLRLGVVILADEPWSTGGGRWRCAEELGFDHAWTYDHLAWRDLRDGPWFATTTTLAAAATVTSTLRLGTMVASPNYRHPVPFSKEVMSLDDLSAGRFTLGLGAGSSGHDATIIGEAPTSAHERADRFEEFVGLLDRLLTEPDVSAAGEHFTAVEVRNLPGCVQRPRVPFAIAATGVRGMRLAARHASTWITYGGLDGAVDVGPEQGARTVAAQVRRLAEVCEAEGRDPRSIERLVLTGPQLDPCIGSVESFRDMLGRYEDAGATDVVVHWPRTSPPYAADLREFVRVISDR